MVAPELVLKLLLREGRLIIVAGVGRGERRNSKKKISVTIGE